MAFGMSLFESIGAPASDLAIAFRDYCFINPFDSEQQLRLGTKLNALPLPPSINPVPGPDVADRPELDRTLPFIRGLIGEANFQIESAPMTVTPLECEVLATLSRGELYFRYRADFEKLADKQSANRKSVQTLFMRFEKDYSQVVTEIKRLEELAYSDRRKSRPMDAPEHAFAIFFQIRRAFGTISSFIKGTSRSINALRAAMWESVFSIDFEMYGDHLFNRMHDINTLVLGSSGTGKELVAQTIGSCRYLPFSMSKGFDAMPDQAFRPVNLSEFSRDLIESELFGHVAGSFTGATSDRKGVFEGCENYHTLFLDEIGELDEAIQVKLLRVLQERSFYRVGDNARQHFGGKIVAATNRNLESEMNAGNFREDLFFRLCADVIRTPTLREQLDDSPDDLQMMVHGICERVLETHDVNLVKQLRDRVLSHIEKNPVLGLRYHWPGNFRELEQCVRSVLIHGNYKPTNSRPQNQTAQEPATTSPAQALANDVQRGLLTWDELLDRYVQVVHQSSKNLTETARRLEKHRSTVQKRLGDSDDSN